ncbi:MAG: hypothetical protein SAK29_28570 [Scytonema sp. PMC 1069.18]|nr:hypothetical protein [Scytonema sp. PMC 1069.18]MEC4882278.1 hypothetical protein [Scytonema sp. PMC 1070.18]
MKVELVDTRIPRPLEIRRSLPSLNSHAHQAVVIDSPYNIYRWEVGDFVE